ncbi:MAG: alpha/beta fold hydrolase [Betaproteobacteria bacterium]
MTRLVFLHGVGGDHSSWDPQVARFGRLGYECLAWDQPGYGAAPMIEPYTLETVTNALKGLLPAVLVGHSMGGLIAQEAYARLPERISALALTFTSAAFVGSSDFAAKFVAERLDPLDAGATMAELAQRVMPQMSGRKSAAGAVARAQKIMAGIPAATYRKAVHLLTTFDRRANLANIAVPTLLMAGTDDDTAPPSIMQRMAAKIPNSEYVLLEGCGHLGPMDQPAQFNAALETFLRNNGL